MATIPQIPSYSILPRESPFKGEWMLVADVAAVFTPGVAYMPVPRCDQCRWWYRGSDDPEGIGRCERFESQTVETFRDVGDEELLFVLASDPQEAGTMFTRGRFGCVQWEGKP
jgi:hypothetical protein